MPITNQNDAPARLRFRLPTPIEPDESRARFTCSSFRFLPRCLPMLRAIRFLAASSGSATASKAAACLRARLAAF